MVFVRCNRCGKWVGLEEDLKQVNVMDKDSDGTPYEDVLEACPECGDTECLMDLHHDLCNFYGNEVPFMYEKFRFADMDQDGYLMEEFLGFQEGTHRSVILDWFKNHGITVTEDKDN